MVLPCSAYNTDPVYNMAHRLAVMQDPCRAQTQPGVVQPTFSGFQFYRGLASTLPARSAVQREGSAGALHVSEIFLY